MDGCIAAEAVGICYIVLGLLLFAWHRFAPKSSSLYFNSCYLIFIGVVKDFYLKRKYYSHETSNKYVTSSLDSLRHLTQAPYFCEPAYTTQNSKLNHNMRILNQFLLLRLAGMCNSTRGCNAGRNSFKWNNPYRKTVSSKRNTKNCQVFMNMLNDNAQ